MGGLKMSIGSNPIVVFGTAPYQARTIETYPKLRNNMKITFDNKQRKAEKKSLQMQNQKYLWKMRILYGKKKLVPPF